jgi:hypothetical protein
MNLIGFQFGHKQTFGILTADNRLDVEFIGCNRHKLIWRRRCRGVLRPVVDTL